MSGKQFRPRTDIASYSVESESTLFDQACLSSTAVITIFSNSISAQSIIPDKRRCPQNSFVISPGKHMLWVPTTYVFVEK